MSDQAGEPPQNAQEKPAPNYEPGKYAIFFTPMPFPPRRPGQPAAGEDRPSAGDGEETTGSDRPPRG